MLKFTVAAILLFACSPALAQAQPASQQPKQGGIVFDDSPAPAAANAKANGRLICQDVGETGSRLAKQRICMTAEQWKQQQERDRDLVANAQRQTTNPGAGNH
jgi:hypothetical protein